MKSTKRHLVGWLGLGSLLTIGIVVLLFGDAIAQRWHTFRFQRAEGEERDEIALYLAEIKAECAIDALFDALVDEGSRGRLVISTHGGLRPVGTKQVISCMTDSAIFYALHQLGAKSRQEALSRSVESNHSPLGPAYSEYSPDVESFCRLGENANVRYNTEIKLEMQRKVRRL